MTDCNETLPGLQEKWFQWLHRHPELSCKEYNTTRYIQEILAEHHITILDTGLETGLIAKISGKKNGPLVALRADIDALPVQENTGLPYTSEYAGVMHACGHDFHTAALLGAACLLKKAEQDLCGDVLLVFQPSEEVSGGAAKILNTGALEGVHTIYGLHVAPEYESGVVALKAGGTFAAVIAFKIRICGKGGHAALPEKCRDPIVAAASLIGMAQSIVSRNFDPFDNVVLSFCHIEAGKTWNVIPEEACIEGTIRALSVDKAKYALERLIALGKGIENAHVVHTGIDWSIDTPATNNDQELTRFAAETARKLGFTVTEYRPTMAGEDFAMYQEKIPGVFLNFGVGSPNGLHHPGFIADTKHLHRASELLAALVSAKPEQ